jgi:serine/threonine-protein kinase
MRVVLDEVLSALVLAHGAGILHRDIKPANILLTAQGSIKVADFGLAKTTEAAHTQTGQIVGTLAYLSPDRLMGRPATVADDLYALGCVGYEALCGRRAFPEETPGALTRSILDDTPPPLRSVRPDVDAALADVIQRAMARDPRQRFVSAEAMRAALANPAVPQATSPRRPSTMVLTAPPFPASPSPSAYIPSSVGATPRRRAAKWAAVGGIIAILALAAVLLLSNSPFGNSPPEPPPSTSVPTSTTTTTTTTTVPEAPPEPGSHKGPKGKNKSRH